jgi:hypothetical protein
MALTSAERQRAYISRLKAGIFNCIYRNDGCIKHKLKVYWNDVSAGSYLKSFGQCQHRQVQPTVSDMTRYEIIGNIYEAP